MARTASKLLDEQLSLARKILSPGARDGLLQANDIMRLASITLELHQKLSTGTAFPTAWLFSPSKYSEPRGVRPTDS
jgi:hypothetical protein